MHNVDEKVNKVRSILSQDKLSHKDYKESNDLMMSLFSYLDDIAAEYYSEVLTLEETLELIKQYLPKVKKVRDMYFDNLARFA